MSSHPPRHVIALVGLLILLLTGQSAALSYVWCIGEDGHAALEYAAGDSCGPAPEKGANDLRPGQASLLSSDDEDCGSCLDLRVSVDARPGRTRDSRELPDQLPLPSVFQNPSVPAFLRVLTTDLHPQPPPRILQSLLVHRTVVLLI